MLININNYEIFFMDYLDGNLNPDQESELLAFLSLHPDKKHELEAMKRFEVPPENQIYEGKTTLKKSINEVTEINDNNFDEFCIAYHEGDLSPGKMEDYLRYIEQHPDKQKTEALFKQTFLNPDTGLHFPNKSKLKKHIVKPLYQKIAWYASAAAAAALLLIGISNLNFPDNQQATPLTQEKIQDSKNNPSSPEAVPKQKESIAENSVTPQDNQEKQINELAGPVNQGQSTTEEENIKESVQDGIVDNKLQKLASISAELNRPTFSYNIHSGRHHAVITRNSPPETEEYQTIPQFAMSKINQTIKKIPADNLVEKTIPNIAATGLQRVYALVENEISIEAETDEDGKKRAFSLNTRYFGFYTTKTKNN